MRRYKLDIGMDIINPSILLENEVFEYVTEDIVPGVYPYYMVSNCGRVYHRYLERIMSPGLETSGYLFVQLSTIYGPKIVQLNRLVLMVFNPIENPEKYQANHKDGVKINNYLYNLEWCTRSENIIHSFRTGLHIPVTTITEQQAIDVVNLLKTGKYQCKEIAKLLNISESIVNSIKGKWSWKHLTEGCEFNARPGRLYSEDDVRKLCEYFQSNPKPLNDSVKSYVYNALLYCGFDNPVDKVDTARKIYTRTHYTNISDYYNF